MSVTFFTSSSAADAPEINVSNVNGRALLDLLGFDGFDGLCGSVPAGELRARAMRQLWPERACALAAESGRSVSVTYGALGATLVECPRRDDYFAGRLTELVRIAEFALLIDGAYAEVSFG